jgi:mycofactocin glycosyltransferase
MTPPRGTLPADFGIALDPGVRRTDGTRVLVGGSPLRVLRLTAAGADLVDALAGGAAVPSGAGAQALVRRLLDAGMAHPRPGRAPFARAEVTLVVPVRDDADAVARLLAQSAALAGLARVIVVDDGSTEPIGEPGGSVELVRCPTSVGPGSARAVGVGRASTALVAFLDADTVPGSQWLEPLLAHFADPAVGAVAPRVRAAAPNARHSTLLHYEERRSPLDLGGGEDRVRPGGRVPYVPTAALVARRDAYHDVGGFDETLRVGEDVDLVWRLAEQGWTVRYEPAVTVHHDIRAGLRPWLVQRHRYGTSAAPLARRHPGAVAPLRISGWSAAAWGLAAGGHPGAGVGVAGATTALLARKLASLENPVVESARIAGRGHLAAGRLIADALRRVWWPLVVALMPGWRRARRVALAAAVLPALVEWASERPRLDPVRWVALRLADDLAYGAGVWTGCAREGSVAALRPDLTSWPGRAPAVETTPGAQPISHSQPTA